MTLNISIISFLIASIVFPGCRVRARNADLVSDQNMPSRQLSLGTPVSGMLVSLGAASAEFIPSQPVGLSGYGGIGRRFFPPLFQYGGEVSFCRSYEKIVNPPRIKVAVLNIEHESSRKASPVFLISLDLVAVTGDLTERIHEALRTSLKDFEPSLTNTLVVATHTHSGPAGLTQNGLWSTFVCDKFNDGLSQEFLQKLITITRDAVNNASRIRLIKTQHIDQPSFLRSRFVGMPPANDISLTSFETPSGDVPLTLVQLAVHPTFYGPRDLTLSADLVTPIEKSIQDVTRAKEVFLLQTSIGNMSAEMQNKDPDAWATAMSSEFTTAEKTTSMDLSFSSQAGFIPLPVPKINWKGCGASYAESLVSLPILDQLPQKTPFALWRLNKSPHLFLSGEWTTSAADALRSKLKDKFQTQNPIKVFSLANEYTAYHITKNDYEQKEMEACSSVFGASGLESILDSLGESELSASF